MDRHNLYRHTGIYPFPGADWRGEQQAVNLRGFRASVNPKFEGRIPDFMDGITHFMESFDTF